MPIEKEITLSYEEFKKYVEEDSHKPERFITRFICVENIEIWKKISEYLRKNGFEQIKASDLAKSNDVLPNTYELIESIRQSKKKLFLTSASEIVSLNKEYGSKFIKDVAMIETSEAFYLDGKKTYPRIFLLMLIDNEVLKSIINEIKRYKEGELYPILKVTAEDLYSYSKDISTVSIVIANFYTSSPDYKRIEGLKEYFNLWDELKIEPNAKIWVYTERAASLQILKPTTTDLKCYSSAYEFLSDKLKFSAPQESDTEDNWRWLAEKYEDEATIEDLIKKILNVQNFDPKDILGRWKTLDKKKKWLALQWPLSKPDESSYLSFIFSESKTAEEFEINAWIRIFDYLKKGNLNQKVISERAELLRKIGSNNPPKEFWNYYNELKNEKEKLLVLSCISESEKNEAIHLFGRLLANEEVSEIEEILKVIFEDLWAYIFFKPKIYVEASAKEKSLSFIDEYLLAYKTSRIKDNIESKIKELLEEWNKGFIWFFTSRFQIIQELKNQNSHFVWVDGLGLEWVSLLSYYLTKEKNLNLTIKIGRANLPTITSTNSIEHNGLSSNEVLTLGRRLDEIAHKSDYKFPEDFLREMRHLKDIAERIKELAEKYEKVVIFSDHGLSRLAILSKEKEELPEGYESLYFGRFAKKVKDFNHNSFQNQRTSYIIDGDYLIMKNLAYFEGANRTSGLAHGGALPEEILVPIIIVEKFIPQSPISQILRLKVILGIDLKGTLEIKEFGNFPDLEINIGSRKFSGEKDDYGIWHFEITNIKKGIYYGFLLSKGKKIADVEITVDKLEGIQEENLGL